MATIRATCTVCGDVELGTADVRVRVDPATHQGTYSFVCPRCDTVVVKPAQPRTVDLLLASGVEYDMAVTGAFVPEGVDDEPIEGGRSPDSGGTGPGYSPSEPGDMPMMLGDVVICPAVAERNAPEHAGTYDDEVALLIVHGILHLLGMDHLEDDEAELMEKREQELLDQFHRPTS